MGGKCCDDGARGDGEVPGGPARKGRAVDCRFGKEPQVATLRFGYWRRPSGADAGRKRRNHVNGRVEGELLCLALDNVKLYLAQQSDVLAIGSETFGGEDAMIRWRFPIVSVRARAGRDRSLRKNGIRSNGKGYKRGSERREGNGSDGKRRRMFRKLGGEDQGACLRNAIKPSGLARTYADDAFRAWLGQNAVVGCRGASRIICFADDLLMT